MEVKMDQNTLFGYIHIHLVVTIWSSILVFSTRGALKYQTNIEAHPPGCLRANQSGSERQGEELEQGEDDETRCREEAHFQPHYPQVCGRVCVHYVHLGISIYLCARLLVPVSVCLCCCGNVSCTCVFGIWEVLEGVGPVY